MIASRPRRGSPTSPARPRTLRAFTLVELLAVVAVLAVLMGVALPKVLDWRSRSTTAADDASIAAIQTGLSLAYNQHRMWNAPAIDWVQTVADVKEVMEGGRLPDGIEEGTSKLRGQTGDTYTFTAETLTSAARLEKDPVPDPSFP